MNISIKRIVSIFGIVTLILLLPLIVMQFTPAVDWSVSDFIIMGVLLFLGILISDFIIRKVKTKQQRILLLLITLLVFLLIWVELAVGIFGTPFAGS